MIFYLNHEIVKKLKNLIKILPKLNLYRDFLSNVRINFAGTQKKEKKEYLLFLEKKANYYKGQRKKSLHRHTPT